MVLKVDVSFDIKDPMTPTGVYKFGYANFIVGQSRHHMITTTGEVLEFALNPTSVSFAHAENTIEMMWNSGSSHLQTGAFAYRDVASPVTISFREKCMKLWNEAGIELTGWLIGTLAGVGLWLGTGLSGMGWVVLAVGIAGIAFATTMWFTQK